MQLGLTNSESPMLSKTAEYALRAVVLLSRDPSHAESAERLAEVTKVPRLTTIREYTSCSSCLLRK